MAKEVLKEKTPPPQEIIEDDPAAEATAMAGLYLLWSRIVDLIVTEDTAAPGPTDLLTDMETKLESCMALDPSADLPASAKDQQEPPVQKEMAQEILEESPGK